MEQQPQHPRREHMGLAGALPRRKARMARRMRRLFCSPSSRSRSFSRFAIHGSCGWLPTSRQYDDEARHRGQAWRRVGRMFSKRRSPLSTRRNRNPSPSARALACVQGSVNGKPSGPPLRPVDDRARRAACRLDSRSAQESAQAGGHRFAFALGAQLLAAAIVMGAALSAHLPILFIVVASRARRRCWPHRLPVPCLGAARQAKRGDAHRHRARSVHPVRRIAGGDQVGSRVPDRRTDDQRRGISPPRRR